MRSLLLVVAVATALVACGGGADTSRLGRAAAPSATRLASPSATQPINVDDMMGLYAQQTVFVTAADHVSAVTLLNHFVRYSISTGPDAQVAVDPAGTVLYVLDPHLAALRAFDVATGAEKASVTNVRDVASRSRAVATAGDGRAFVLKADSQHAWVDAYAPNTLAPQGTVAEKAGCGDRLLTSGFRIAIVCLATGEIVVDTLRGTKAAFENPMPRLAGAAMAGDGSIYVVTADQRLGIAGPNSTRLSPLRWPSEWSGSVVPDGLAIAAGSEAAVIAEKDTDGVWLRVFSTLDIAQRHSVRLPGEPQSGIIALYPFVYYGIGRSVMHSHIENGMWETMTEIGAGAAPGAVVNR